MTTELNDYKTRTTSVMSENERFKSVIVPL